MDYVTIIASGVMFNTLYYMLYAYIMYFIPIRNDIALMKLDSPVYDNGYVAIAEVPYSGQVLPNGFTCYITGWGLLASKFKKVFHNNFV